jgi:hypothetical protein
MLQPELLTQALPEEAMPKVEKILRGCFLPHLGHFISLSLSATFRRASNFSPQFVHSYSYIGIVSPFQITEYRVV